MDEQLATTMKEGARTTWAAGDFDVVAQLIWPVGGGLVERLGIASGERVLDIAAGTGNASIPAAERGGEVVASDLTPELFEAGRRHAAEAGVEVEWVEADAEALPFDDGSFDVVVSTFGIMFAPRHEVAAAEAVRVLRPGGRFGFCCWRPDGQIGTFFKTVASHMPPPPDGFMPPPMWGLREHVESLFADSGVELEFHDEIADFDFDSAEQAVELMASKFGPMVMARKALEPEGKWEPLRSEVLAMYEAESEPRDGGIRFRGEYLTTIGRKPA
jgi:ubiquinone/menaquinone biosynthesis C-methylase UbiE